MNDVKEFIQNILAVSHLPQEIHLKHIGKSLAVSHQLQEIHKKDITKFSQVGWLKITTFQII